MLLDGPRKHYLFQIAAFFDEIIDGVLVRDPDHILFNDRPGVKIGCHVMACGSDQFHSSLIGLMIGLGTDECREERMVYIYDAVRAIARSG